MVVEQRGLRQDRMDVRSAARLEVCPQQEILVENPLLYLRSLRLTLGRLTLSSSRR